MVLCSSVSLGRRRNRGEEKGGGGERETLEGAGCCIYRRARRRRGVVVKPRWPCALFTESYCERERVREVEEKGEGERMTGGSGPVHEQIYQGERSKGQARARLREAPELAGMLLCWALFLSISSDRDTKGKSREKRRGAREI